MPNSSYAIKDIHFMDALNGLAVGGNYSIGGVVLRSTDGGESWIVDQSFPHDLNYIDFETSVTGTIYGDTGYTLKTTDSGQTWNEIPRITDHPLKTKRFENGVAYLSGISSSLSHSLLKKPIKPTAIAFAQEEVCSGTPFFPENESINARIFTWQIDGEIYSQTESPELVINQPGIHTVELIASSCGDTDTTSFLISVLPLPSPDLLLNEISLTKDTLLCNIQHAIVELDEEFLSYAWHNGSAESSLELNETTTLWVDVKGNNGCFNRSDTINIVFQTNPIADFEFLIDNGEVTFLNKSSSANSYSWNFGDGEISTEVNPIKVYTDNGLYSVSLTAENECGEITSIRNLNILIVGLEFPVDQINSFYPNPTRGMIYFQHSELPISIKIFNSTGQVVYSDNGSKSFIDLTSLFPAGIYFLSQEFSGNRVSTRKLVVN
jgi:PKD repeat protein